MNEGGTGRNRREATEAAPRLSARLPAATMEPATVKDAP